MYKPLYPYICIYIYNYVIIYVYIHGIIYTYTTGIFNWGDDGSSKWSKPSPSLKRDESHADPTCFWSSPDELPPASSATWTIRSLEQGKKFSKAMGLAKFLKGIAPQITLKFWKSWEVLSLGFPFSRFLPSNWHNSQSDWGLVQRHQSGSQDFRNGSRIIRKPTNHKIFGPSTDQAEQPTAEPADSTGGSFTSFCFAVMMFRASL